MSEQDVFEIKYASKTGTSLTWLKENRTEYGYAGSNTLNTAWEWWQESRKRG